MRGTWTKRLAKVLLAILLATQLAVPAAAGRKGFGYGKRINASVVHAPPVPSVTYDQSIGSGVADDGIANLPLRTGGTDGADAASGAPTSLGTNMSYTAGTRTVSSSGIGSQTIAKWLGALTVGQSYHVVIDYNITSFAAIELRDNAGNTQAVLFPNTGGTSNNSGTVDMLFTATSADMVLFGTGDFFTGSLQMVKVAPNSGGIGARRFFVNSGTGSDANSCSAAQGAGTPKLTLAAGVACAQNGRGDQVLLAQNTTYTAGLPTLDAKGGFDAIHPFVIQTYDPADPTNESKYGRPAIRPKVNTGGTLNQNVMTNGPASYIAIRGLDFDAGGHLPNLVINFISAATPINYLLFENIVFREHQLVVQEAGTSSQPVHLIVRGVSSYGQWSDIGAGGANPQREQGIYLDNWASYTIEDSTFWHNGWKVGATRDDSQASGGLTNIGTFVHPIYAQGNSTGIVRRSFMADGGADGGHMVGPVTFTENTCLDCPIAIGLGGFGYDVYRPSGSDLQISYNAILGDADTNTANPRGLGVLNANGASGSSFHHNLIARSRNPALADHSFPALSTNADHDQPSYMDYHDNVIYLWRASGYDTSVLAAFPAQVHATFNTNLWDDPTSGTNVNNVGHVFPNAYTLTTLLAQLGYANKQAMIDYLIANPQDHAARRVINSTLMTGYGILGPPAVPTLGTLVLSSTSYTRATPTSGSITGATATSTLTTSGLPSGLTINSGARTWAWDGSGTGAASGTWTLTETLAGATNTPHANTINYSIAAAGGGFASLSTAAFDKYSGITLDGAHLHVTPGAVGSNEAVRATREAGAGKTQFDVTINDSSPAVVYVGLEDGTTDFSASGVAPGFFDNKGYFFRVLSSGWDIWNNATQLQSNGGGALFVTGDILSVVFDKTNGTLAFYRTHSGTTTQVGSNVTGVSLAHYFAWTGGSQPTNGDVTFNFGATTLVNTGTGASAY